MTVTARLHGGPKDGTIVPVEESVPFELNLTVYLNIRDADPDADVITGVIIYRRRGNHLEALTLGEPIPYDFVGPAKRGSKR